MRLVQVTIPAGRRNAVFGALDEQGVDYVVSDETSGREFTAVVSFPLPTNAVEPVLDSLREVGIDADAYTVVLNAEAVVSRRFEELTERFEETEKSDERVAREELQATAKSLAPSTGTYLSMTVLSVVIATIGILMDSAAVVVGSMVIAPLIGPAMATSVGTVVDERELFVRGVKLQIVGFAVGIAAAALFAWTLRSLHLVPPGIEVLAIGQVEERLAPDFLSLVVALGAGVAGAYSLSSGVSSSLVGVMIAVALVPPVAVVGIGLAWALPMLVAGAGVLAAVNAFSINLAALGTLWYAGYRPEYWRKRAEARSQFVRRAVVMIVVIGMLSVFLGAVTVSSVQSASFEDAVQDDVSSVLELDRYASVSLIEMHVEYTGVPPFQSAERVVVTVGRPPGEATPSLASTLDARIEERAKRDVAVTVRYVEVESA